MAVSKESEAQTELDTSAQKAFVLRTKSMSELELLEYVSETMRLVSASRPQRRR